MHGYLQSAVSITYDDIPDAALLTIEDSLAADAIWAFFMVVLD